MKYDPSPPLLDQGELTGRPFRSSPPSAPFTDFTTYRRAVIDYLTGRHAEIPRLAEEAFERAKTEAARLRAVDADRSRRERERELAMRARTHGPRRRRGRRAA